MEARSARKVSVRAIVLLIAVALVVLALDQLAKWWVVNNLPFREPQNVLGTLLIFEYDRNPGAAFSIGTGSTWIFSIIAVAVLVFVIWYARRIRSVVWAIVFGLVLGGLLGNLTDRLLRPPGFGRGEVVDFLRIPLLPAIFNLADSAIVCAMVLFLILTVMGVGLDGKRAAAKPTTGTAAGPASGPGGDGVSESERSATSVTSGDDVGTSSEDPAGPSHAGVAGSNGVAAGASNDSGSKRVEPGEADSDTNRADDVDAGDGREGAGSRVAGVGHPVDGRA